MPVAFVTGVAGQDGTLLARRLVADGVTVHGLARDEVERSRALAGSAPGVTVHVADLTDHDRVAGLVSEVEPDQVYNLAGISSVGFSWEQPVVTGAVSGLAAVALFEAAARTGERLGRPVRVVQASSSEVFGRPSRAPQDEALPLRPVSPYGAAKAYAHLMAAVYRERGVGVSTVILYNHESPLRPATFVTRKITMAAARMSREPDAQLALGDLTARRDWGWAEDYVDAMVRVAGHPVADDFVVATGRTHSVADFVATAMDRAGVADWQSRVHSDPALLRPAETAEQVGDASKARRELGWSPTVTFEEVVARMVDHDLAELDAAR